MASATAATRAGKTRANLIRFAAIVASLFLVSILIMNESRAAFSETTANSSNGFAATDITLADNDLGSAMFTVTGMVPGESVESCIRIDYTATADATSAIKVYRNAYVDSGDFGTYLNISIEEETTSSATAFNDCTGFVGEAVPGTTTLSALGTGYASAVGTWTPTATASKWYKVIVTLDSATPNGEQGESVSGLTFTWEAQTVAP